MELSAKNEHKQLSFPVDPETDKLRLNYSLLISEIQELDASKSELEKIIYEFGVRHDQELGALILAILKFRKEETKGTQFETQTKSEYDEFFSSYESSKNKKINILNDSDQKELKDKYRKASKLCHPDVVDESLKETAHQIFTALNNAYKDNDLISVTRILESLESGNSLINKTKKLSEKEFLLAEIERLAKHIEYLKLEIEELLNSTIYQKIISISNLDTYFENARKELLKQITELEDGGE